MSVINKESKAYSIVHLKCPKCHEGNLFCESNAWNLKKMIDMPDRCPVCNQDFIIEPGFYSGALWISYPIVIAIGLILMSPLLLYPDYFNTVLFTTVLIIFLLQPIIMRWGRAIWINIFVHYSPNKISNQNNENSQDNPKNKG